MDIVFPRWGKRAAHGGPPLVYAARYMDTDLPHEGHTARGTALSALHGDKTVVDIHCQIGGYAAQGDRVGLSPVKRRPVECTTGAALQAGIVVYYCTSGIALRKDAACRLCRWSGRSLYDKSLRKAKKM